MNTRVTIQDIADELGISRNTVSKAINNTGVLAASTRDKVLKKAIEMGYKQFSYVTIPDTGKTLEPALDISGPKEIALFTSKFLGDAHFSSTMLDKFQREITQLGYSLSIHRLLADDIKHLRLPNSFSAGRTSGIICYEMFDHPYSQMLCATDIPVLFVDSPVIGLGKPLKADCLYMDNQSSIYEFIQEMVRRGKKKIGFIGEYLHCQSFYERFMAYRDGLYLMGLPYSEEYCLLENKAGVDDPSSTDYQEYLTQCFLERKSFPDVYICANDFVAMDVIQVLNKLGYSVPKDVYLCGFDDTPELKMISPALTTIHIHSQIMGYSAVYLLISRIKEPSLNYRTIHTETDLIYRESTEDNPS